MLLCSKTLAPSNERYASMTIMRSSHSSSYNAKKRQLTERLVR